MKTAIYARYSSHAQDEGTSIEVQLEVCHKAAGEKCIEYVDKAKSGTTMMRPEFQRMLADAEKGKFDKLYVYKYDRFGRNAQTHATVADLESLGVEVISATEGKDALARGMHLVIAEHYSKVLAERTRAGLRKRFEQRCWVGGMAPYGYEIITRDGHRVIQTNKAEAKMIKQVIAWYLHDSVGYYEIAKRLQEHGYPTRNSRPWCKSSVKSILTCPIITGRLQFNRRHKLAIKSTGNKVLRPNGEAEILAYQDESLRIISDETWEQVQDKLSQRKGSHPQRSAITRAFTGLVRCAECGSLLYHRFASGRDYLVCGTKRGKRGECSSTIHVREADLLRLIMDKYQQVFADEAAFIDEAVALITKLATDGQERVRGLEKQISQLDEQITGTHALLLDRTIGDVAKRTLSEELGRLGQQREECRASLVNSSSESTETMAREINATLAEAKAMFQGTTGSQVHAFVERFVGPMLISHDGCVAPGTDQGAGGHGHGAQPGAVDGDAARV